MTKCPSAPSPSHDQEILVAIKLAAAGSCALCTLDLAFLQKADWSLRHGLTWGGRGRTPLPESLVPFENFYLGAGTNQMPPGDIAVLLLVFTRGG